MIRKPYNLVGQRFGYGIVTKELGIETVNKNAKYPRQYQLWELLCNCGNTYQSSTRYLINNGGKHCGCQLKKDLGGMRFGAGVVIGFAGHVIRGIKTPRPACRWELQCDCGKIYKCISENLLNGMTSSCGCQKKLFHNNCNEKSISIYIKNLKSDAKRRNRKFELTKLQIETLLLSQQNKCKLSGLPIEIENGTASLDRIDNTGHYTLDNVQWVHRKINYMKNTLQQNDFLNLCKTVFLFQNGNINI